MEVSDKKAIKAKPFIKWVGGKRQIINRLLEKMPKEYNRYFELFVGGGALLYNIDNDAHDIIINDLNTELINAYTSVKNELPELIHLLLSHKNSEEYFYDIRAWDREESYSDRTFLEKASRFIYLNKTVYNGLYRVNKSNQFNAPFGRYSNPMIVDQKNLKNCSLFLKNITIENKDYFRFLNDVNKNDFVYLDPPYIPLSKSSNFASYTDTGFGIDEHKRLREFCDQLSDKGAFFMLSNSYSDLSLELYRDYIIHDISAKRSINSKGDSRGKVREILVTNY